MLFTNIPQGHCMIVERFRKPSRVCGSGLHFFIPLLDKAKNVRDGRFSCGWGDNTNKNGIFTIDVSGEIHESLLCTLTAADTEHVYESKTNQVIITWSGTSYDKSSGKFVVNDCSFQMTRATASGSSQQSL
jgi:regulator of protease activity HflC (stomatin/prohibitin superfamily)